MHELCHGLSRPLHRPPPPWMVLEAAAITLGRLAWPRHVFPDLPGEAVPGVSLFVLVGECLARLFGRKAGEVPGYAYSPALKQSGLVWDGASVDRLFADGPEAMVPGSKMPLQRMPDAQDRAELIRFLEHATRPKDSP